MASGSQTGRQGRMKWSEEMTSVLLECKRKAVELTKSDNPPLQDNGRKKGLHVFDERVVGGAGI